MRKRFLKKELRRLDIPAFDVEAVQNTIRLAKAIDLHPERIRMTNYENFWSQARFIQKRTWLLKVLLTGLLLALAFFYRIDLDHTIWTASAIFGSIICLVSIYELCRVYHPGMREVQLTAKYSLKKVIMVRLILLGIVDFILLLSSAYLVSGFGVIVLWKILLYTIAPFSVMCGGCIDLVNRVREENVMSYCTTWGIMMITCILLLRITGIELLQNRGDLILGIILAIGLWKTITEIKKLMSITGGNLDAIEFGTSFQEV